MNSFLFIYICSLLLLLAAEKAMVMGQDLQRVGFKDRSWLGYKTRSSELLLNIVVVVVGVSSSSSCEAGSHSLD